MLLSLSQTSGMEDIHFIFLIGDENHLQQPSSVSSSPHEPPTVRTGPRVRGLGHSNDVLRFLRRHAVSFEVFDVPFISSEPQATFSN